MARAGQCRRQAGTDSSRQASHILRAPCPVRRYSLAWHSTTKQRAGRHKTSRRADGASEALCLRQSRRPIASPRLAIAPGRPAKGVAAHLAPCGGVLLIIRLRLRLRCRTRRPPRGCRRSLRRPLTPLHCHLTVYSPDGGDSLPSPAPSPAQRSPRGTERDGPWESY